MSMKRTTVDGRTVNQRTADMIARAEARLGYDLRVVQGSYNAGGVSASAGTHDGGGAVDFSVTNLNGSEINEIVLALREVGFAAWHRTASQGPWSPHIHAIAIGDDELSSGAANQVKYYYAGLDGLASHRSDDGPRLQPVPVWPIPTPRVLYGVVAWQFKANKPKKKIAVRRIQTALKGRGYYKSAVDGVAGPKTRQAFQAFLRRRGLHGGLNRANIKVLCHGYFNVV